MSQVKSLYLSNLNLKNLIDERFNFISLFSFIFRSTIGEYTTRVFYDDIEVKGSPYVFRAFDPTQVVINGLSTGKVYQVNKKIELESK
jgi:hypothetical protein